MSERALGSAPRIAVRLALALVFVAAAAIYSVVYEDPYVALLILPFFALGVARGKHPVILATPVASAGGHSSGRQRRQGFCHQYPVGRLRPFFPARQRADAGLQ
jgi:hypothetical protein